MTRQAYTELLYPEQRAGKHTVLVLFRVSERSSNTEHRSAAPLTARKYAHSAVQGLSGRSPEARRRLLGSP
eukprot:5036614-Prorocentrum_lima.AAC.1